MTGTDRRRGGRPPGATVVPAALADVLGPALLGAACAGHPDLFDPPHPGEDPDDLDYRHAAAIRVCLGCPALAGCRDAAPEFGAQPGGHGFVMAAQLTGPRPDSRRTSMRRAATPYVTKLAAESGVNLDAVTGTGVGGRITPNDVRAAAGPDTEQHVSSTLDGESWDRCTEPRDRPAEVLAPTELRAYRRLWPDTRTSA